MAVPRRDNWGGGVCSYIRPLPDGFLLKAIVLTACEHEYMNNIHHASSYGPGNSFRYFMYLDYLGFEIQLKPELWKLVPGARVLIPPGYLHPWKGTH